VIVCLAHPVKTTGPAINRAWNCAGARGLERCSFQWDGKFGRHCIQNLSFPIEFVRYDIRAKTCITGIRKILRKKQYVQYVRKDTEDIIMRSELPPVYIKNSQINPRQLVRPSTSIIAPWTQRVVLYSSALQILPCELACINVPL
jgi:hypothetical protein